MLPDDVQIISVDDHIVEHPRVWLDRLAQFSWRALVVIGDSGAGAGRVEARDPRRASGEDSNPSIRMADRERAEFETLEGRLDLFLKPGVRRLRGVPGEVEGVVGAGEADDDAMGRDERGPAPDERHAGLSCDQD